MEPAPSRQISWNLDLVNDYPNWKISVDPKKLIVTRVHLRSHAWSVGIRPGYRISNVAGVNVVSLLHARKLLSAAKKQGNESCDVVVFST